MSPTKPNRATHAPEFDLDPVPRLALAIECVPAREEHGLRSFLLFGALGLPQEQVEGSEYLVGHA